MSRRLDCCLRTKNVAGPCSQCGTQVDPAHLYTEPEDGSEGRTRVLCQACCPSCGGRAGVRGRG